MNEPVYKIGFYSSFIAFLAVVGYAIVQIMQILRVTAYPTDAILIYGFSLCIAPPYMIAVTAFHYTAPEGRKIWSHIAILFANMYTIFVVIMYSVQLATVITQSLKDPAVTLLTVIPHSFFWTLDAIGYISFGLSTLFAAFAVDRVKENKLIRFMFIANGLMVPVIGLVYFYPHFSTVVLLIASPWIITASGSMLLLALYFKRETRLNKKKVTLVTVR